MRTGWHYSKSWSLPFRGESAADFTDLHRLEVKILDRYELSDCQTAGLFNFPMMVWDWVSLNGSDIFNAI